MFSSQLDIPSMDMLANEIEELKRHLNRVESPTVLCHNDLLTKNIIYNSDEGEITSSCVVLKIQAGRQASSNIILTCKTEIQKSENWTNMEIINKGLDLYTR